MHLAFIALSVVLAIVMAATGIPKALGAASAQRNAEHLGVTIRLIRLIGGAEIAATAGLLIGIAVAPLAAVTAAAVAVLMGGAIYYHLRAGDTPGHALPALGTGIVAVAILALRILETRTT